MRVISNFQSIFYNERKLIDTDKELSPKILDNKISKNFDEILINKEVEISDDKFINDLRSHIIKEVNILKTDKELEEIKFEIQNNNYQIGIEEVTKRILF